MEGKKSPIAADPVAMEVLDKLYFPEPLDTLYEEVKAAPSVIRDVILSLLDGGLISILRYDETRRDWLPTAIFDKDNLAEYRFVITRRGLLLHHRLSPQ